MLIGIRIFGLPKHTFLQNRFLSYTVLQRVRYFYAPARKAYRKLWMVAHRGKLGEHREAERAGAGIVVKRGPAPKLEGNTPEDRIRTAKREWARRKRAEAKAAGGQTP